MLSALALSVFASMLTRRTPAAILLSYVCVWTVLFGFFWAAWLADMDWNQRYGHDYYATVAFCSPMAGCVYHLYTLGFPEDMRRFFEPNPFQSYWVFNVLFHFAFALVLLFTCTRAFRLSRMQEP
jgi:hypothetical protein